MCSKENDTILGFISQILMDEEDEEENEPYMFHDPLALQATEQSLYEAINSNTHQEPPYNSDHHHLLGLDSSQQNLYHQQLEDDHLAQHHHSNKHLANSPNAGKPHEQLTICNGMLVFINNENKSPNDIKQDTVAKEFVDLRSLLMQCAEAMADFKNEHVNSLILQIRRHSSPHGSAAERVAHYFVNALEARLIGTGTVLVASINPRRITGAEILKGHRMFVKACPLLTMTNLLANGTVMEKLAKKGATTLHIIDFGILMGFQWLSLILALSERPEGPPKLRITGIDFPQPGIRPDEKVLDTGGRLEEYCERFGVPFEFNAIARKWDTIRLEDLKIEKGEFVVVNSIFRLQNVMDQTDMESMNVPRDDILNLIRRVNPEMFVHAVISGAYNAPFFLARFREAFYNFSSLYDMLEATVPPEEDDQSARVGFEEHFFGRSVMSVVACDGPDRVDRPETYKQWQYRTVRAGFRQISLDKEIVKHVREMVKEDYHKDFTIGKDGKWILLAWKGRVLHGISCWRPTRVHD